MSLWSISTIIRVVHPGVRARRVSLVRAIRARCPHPSSALSDSKLYEFGDPSSTRLPPSIAPGSRVGLSRGLDRCNVVWRQSANTSEPRPYWEWEPAECNMEPFNVENFCRLMEARKGLLLVGELCPLLPRAVPGGSSRAPRRLGEVEPPILRQLEAPAARVEAAVAAPGGRRRPNSVEPPRASGALGIAFRRCMSPTTPWQSSGPAKAFAAGPRRREHTTPHQLSLRLRDHCGQPGWGAIEQAPAIPNGMCERLRLMKHMSPEPPGAVCSYHNRPARVSPALTATTRPQAIA